jgi:hypothetical protein
MLSAWTVAALLAVAGTPAEALTIVLRDLGAAIGNPMPTEELAAFRSAADHWQGWLADPVTVSIAVDFSDQGANGTLGSTRAATMTESYATLRDQLGADKTSALDSTAVAHLPTGAAVAWQVSTLDGGSRFDNDAFAGCDAQGHCGTNNLNLQLTTANAAALGLALPRGPGEVDGTVAFNGAYAGLFQFDRAGGIAAGRIDFTAVAEHEIGHVLGFQSGVDAVDTAYGCAGSPDPNCMEDLATYTLLDLFRYSAPGMRDVQVGGAPYLSVDGGLSVIANFSTGRFGGNGYQADHFAPGSATLMRPFIRRGETYDASAADLAAMDAIGWDLESTTTPVPEPDAASLMAAGLAAGLLSLALRRRSGGRQMPTTRNV